VGDRVSAYAREGGREWESGGGGGEERERERGEGAGFRWR
jgi:hypothetical protein